MIKKENFNKVKKKLLICLLIIIVVIGGLSVYKVINILLKEHEFSVQQREMFERLSEDSKEEELEFIEAETEIKKLIKKNKIMIKEFDSIHMESRDESWIPIFDLINTWNPALAFDGYKTGVDISIYPLHFPPEDYYMFQQMIVSVNEDNRKVEYNIFFTKNFENINMERYSLFIKGVFGVDISSEKLKNAMAICSNKIDTVTQGSQFDYELYSKNDILIKMVAMEDVTGDKYVAICSKYTPK